MAKGSGTGQGGKTLQDRELAAKVRTKGLNELMLILNDDEKTEKWSDLKKATMQRLAPTLLPRINENTGPNGGPMEVTITGVDIKIRK